MLALQKIPLVICLSVLVRCEVSVINNLLIQSFQLDGSPAFTYSPNDRKGPESWGRTFPNCSRNRQSPVNILTTANPARIDRVFTINGLSELPLTISATNNGHSLAIKLNYANQSAVFFDGGPLHGRYIVDNIHWHWGASNDNDGSEHAIDGRKFAAEAHIVAYNSKYGNVESSLAQSDGIAVLGILYEVKLTQ